jgi:hypothetical protein
MFPNSIIHRVWSEIRAVWPLNRAQCDSGLGKNCRVPQRLKHSPVDLRIAQKRTHVDLARRAIEKSHAQPAVGQSGHRPEAPDDGMLYRRLYFHSYQIVFMPVFEILESRVINGRPI